jgi:hypothetical protein
MYNFQVDGLILKVYDDKNWNVITLDHLIDSISSLAISSYGRLAPPEKVNFCGTIDVVLSIKSWRPIRMTDTWGG